MVVPSTPLHTTRVLTEDKEMWDDVKVSTSATLTYSGHAMALHLTRQILPTSGITLALHLILLILPTSGLTLALYVIILILPTSGFTLALQQLHNTAIYWSYTGNKPHPPNTVNQCLSETRGLEIAKRLRLKRLINIYLEYRHFLKGR